MKKLILSLLVGMLFAFQSFPSFSQNIVPNPPQQLSAIPEELSDGTYNVTLHWVVGDFGAFPQGFKIYKTIFQNGMVTTFLEAELQAKQGEYKYSYVVKNLQPGTYEFYATAFIGKAESKPSNTVRVELIKTKPFIKIISQPLTIAYVGKKYIYQVKAQTNINCPIDIFELEGNVPDGMTISKTGLIEWTPSTAGKYEISVKVGTTCKINVEPARQTFVIIVYENSNDNKPYVRIVSQPPTIAFVGIQLTYQVVVETNIRCPVKFKLIDGNMAGAEIDENTGLFTWTPEQTGTFATVIVAYLSCDTNVLAYQRLCINVKESNQGQKHCAHIIGSAKFQDDTPVPNGFVNAWKLDGNDKQTNIVFKTLIKNGNFEFFLPEGTYVFEFYGDLFEQRFYMDAVKFKDATRVKLLCQNNQTNDYTLEMILQKKPEPIFYNVSGLVKSSKDDTPILAVVEFIPVEFLFNPDKRQNYGVVTNFVTKTDQNGKYQIKLPNNFTYIAHAIPSNTLDYQDQYYYLSKSPYLADIIELEGDRDDINFLLEPFEKYNNGFSGIVVDKDRNPIQSRVLAIMLQSKQQNFYAQKGTVVRVVETNDNGQFTFKNLPQGDYILLSLPKDKQFTPGYYKANDFATLKWKEATVITVDQSMIQIIYEIKHRNRSSWKGLVRFEGQVIDASENIKIENQPQFNQTNVVSEALVCALDEEGNIIDYYITDANGSFILETLPPTTFKILVSKVGYKDTEVTYTGDYENNFAYNTNLYIEKEVSQVPENIDLLVSQTEHNLIITFKEEFSVGKVEIFDTYGNSIRPRYSQFSNNLRIDISNLNSGVYFVTIQRNNEIIKTKFIIVR